LADDVIDRDHSFLAEDTPTHTHTPLLSVRISDNVCCTYRKDPTVPWTARVDPCVLVVEPFLPSSWSSFLRRASSLRVCRLRANSGADKLSEAGTGMLLGGVVMVERLTEGAPTVEPEEGTVEPEDLR
jgi:hypothetical protein